VAQLEGIVPIMVTPMIEGGEPDEESIHRLVNYLIDCGVGGLWVLGSASEDINMSWEGRVRTVCCVTEAVNGRIRILTGTGLTTVNDILRFIDDIGGLDLAGVHVLYLDPKQGNKRMIAEMIRLADHSEYPIWLYHNPKRGKPVSLEVIKALRDHPNIRGMKVGGYNLTNMTQAIMHRTSDFDVIGAGGGQCFVMLSLGCDSHTCSDACCWPEEFIKLYKLFREGKLDEAREQQFKVLRLAERLPRTDNGEFAAEEKYILSIRGICEEHVNPAYRTLTNDEKEKVRQALRDYGFDWV
jgi:dihydrodipicolinate synthase/N-acetylneuraminate lyase